MQLRADCARQAPGMDEKTRRFDRSIVRLLSTLGVCAVLAVGLLGIHSAETDSGAAAPTDQVRVTLNRG